MRCASRSRTSRPCASASSRFPLRKRRRIPGLKAERADIILAGAITVEEVMRFGGYGALTVCKGGVRDGILWQETFNGRG